MPSQYATAEDFRAHFGALETSQLTDFENEGSENAVVLNRALKNASAEVDSYLTGRYSLPLPSAAVLAPLVVITCDVARYRLYKDRPTDEVTTRYKLARSQLSDFAFGKANIVFEPPLTVAEAATSQIPLAASGRATDGVFSDAILAMQPRALWPD